jgi:FkbM family methyltransferase
MSAISTIREKLLPLLLGWIPDSFLGLLEKEIQIQLGKGWGSTTTSHEVAAIAQFVIQKNLHQVVALDVGANLGNWSSALLEVIPTSKIVAFEPSKAAFDQLNQRFENFSSINCENIALGSENKKATLFSNKSASGWASLTERRLDHFGVDFSQTEDTTVQTLDHWIANSENLPLPNILKMDVEGHELDVLIGAKQSLNTIEIIQFEFGGCNIDTRTFLQDFWYFLCDRNFDLFRVTPRGVRLVNNYKESDEIFSTTNYIAVRK